MRDSRRVVTGSGGEMRGSEREMRCLWRERRARRGRGGARRGRCGSYSVHPDGSCGLVQVGTLNLGLLRFGDVKQRILPLHTHTCTLREVRCKHRLDTSANRGEIKSYRRKRRVWEGEEGRGAGEEGLKAGDKRLEVGDERLEVGDERLGVEYERLGAEEEERRGFGRERRGSG